MASAEGNCPRQTTLLLSAADPRMIRLTQMAENQLRDLCLSLPKTESHPVA
jgi:hypothetical protein